MSRRPQRSTRFSITHAQPNHRPKLCAVALLLGSALSSATSAQAVIDTWSGVHAGDKWGQVVERIGDVNGDGKPDIAVGAPSADRVVNLPFPVFIIDAGVVTIYSGASGAELWSVTGTIAGGTEFGSAIADAGDVNGDGRDEVLVGAPNGHGAVAGSGTVQLFNGANGALLRTFQGIQAGERFGSAICAGSLTPDPSSDHVAIGAPRHDIDDNLGGIFQEGRVVIFRLTDGALLLENLGTDYPIVDNFLHPDAVERSHWGAQLAFLGDRDGDGFGEIGVSGPFSDYVQKGTLSVTTYINTGFVRVFEPLGDPPSPLLDTTWEAGVTASLLGTELAALPEEITIDGFVDYVVSEPGAARVRHYSGSLTTPSYLTHPCLSGVQSLASPGDVNGDGVPDLLAGVPGGGLDAGSVCVISGATGNMIDELVGPAPGVRFGGAVAGADFDGDGLAEIVVGARFDDTVAMDAGAVYVFSESDCVSPASWNNYGIGLAGTLGIPALFGAGTPSLGDDFPITVGNAAGTTALAFSFVGFAPASVSVKGGTLLVDASQLKSFALPAGGVTLQLPVPNDAALCGLDVFLQVLHADPGAPFGAAFTQGMQLHFGS